MPSKQPEKENLYAHRMERQINNYYIDDKSCWRHRNKPCDRYGYVKLMAPDHKSYRVHRLSYVLYKGQFDLNLEVCHTCDTANCMNPDHLYLDTHKGNMQDRINKGRHWRAVSNDDISLMVVYREMGKTQEEISMLVGVSQSTVSRYLNGN